MNFLGEFFRAVAEFFGFIKQQNDPEVIRKAKLNDIEKKLTAERKKRDVLLSQKINPENEVQHAIDLGIVINSLIQLHEQHKILER